jgi:hypothetical protein
VRLSSKKSSKLLTKTLLFNDVDRKQHTLSAVAPKIWIGGKGQMPTLPADEPVSARLPGHDFEIVLIDAVRATNGLSLGRRFPFEAQE